MPIEIREIIIRAVVGQNEGGTAPSGGGQAPSSGGTDPVQEAVEQTLQVIDDKKQR
jgi:hypothetical protein